MIRLLITIAVATVAGAVAARAESVPFDSADTLIAQSKEGANVAPKTGTVYDYTRMTRTITEAKDNDFEFKVKDFDKIEDRTRDRRCIGWLWCWFQAAYTFDQKLVKDFWPLSVGRSVKIRTTRDQGVWDTTLTVLRTETITVPAGIFHAFVIQDHEIAIGGTYEATMLTWYSPDLPGIVKRTFKQARGRFAGTSWDDELLKVTK